MVSTPYQSNSNFMIILFGGLQESMVLLEEETGNSFGVNYTVSMDYAALSGFLEGLQSFSMESEISSVNPPRTSMRKFNNFINFTWSNLCQLPPLSDHFHILLESSNLKWGPCLLHKDFLKLIESWWPTIEMQGYAIIRKLKLLSQRIRAWNTNIYSKLYFQRSSMHLEGNRGY